MGGKEKVRMGGHFENGRDGAMIGSSLHLADFWPARFKPGL